MIKLSPIIPANSLIIPVTFLNVAPFFEKSSRYLVNSFISDMSITKPSKPVGRLKLSNDSSISKNPKTPLAIFQERNAIPIAVAISRTSLRCFFIFSKILFALFSTSPSKKLYSGSSNPRPSSPPPPTSPIPPPIPPAPAIELMSSEIIFNSSIPKR